MKYIKVYEESEFTFGEPGPNIVVPQAVNTIANTLVASGSDGMISGGINPGDIGGEFPKKFSPGLSKPYKQHINIKNVKPKKQLKRKKSINKIIKLNRMLFFKDFINVD